MTAEKDNRAPVEHEFKKANPFEKVGIWAGYRLLQYLESLDVAPAKPVSNYTRQPSGYSPRTRIENIAMGIIIAGGVFLIGSMAVDNIRRTQIAPYSIGVGQEQTRPEQSVLLDKPGSIATFRYGAIINNVEGLSLQVFPHKMEEVLREANLVPPPGSILITELTNSSKAGEDASLIALAHARYEREQGIAYFSTIAPLNYQDAMAGPLTGERADLNRPAPHIQLGAKWLKWYKSFVAVVRGNRQNFDPDVALTPQEILIAGRGLPFWIVSAP